ncbi:MAG: amidophosphoribosyltransferase [Bacteroidota bacterium]|nr:amidophosphoribosyltransferase [Bacteroidota bacterium]
MNSITPKDKPIDHCGIFGIYGHPKAAIMTYYGLQALQHRGQEGAGIVTSEYNETLKRFQFNVHKDFGLVNDVFKDDSLLINVLKGNSAIGHNRYSTAGSAYNKLNIQPLTVNYKGGNLAISHNGNITNFRKIRNELQNLGTIFQTTSDTEIVLHLMARSKYSDQVRQVIEALNQIEGAFSFVILTDEMLIASRDPHGWRPLNVGKLEGAFIVASETCAFDIIGAEYIGEIKPGEVQIFDKEALLSGKPRSLRLKNIPSKPHYCIFEYIYFSRPDSYIFGESVDKIRRRLGKALAEEHPVKLHNPEDRIIVINVPDSSNTATLGFVSRNNKIGNPTKYEIGLIRSHYVGRTFIQPEQDDREIKVKTKFNKVKGVLKDKVVVIVDDSIVRGTTSNQLVKLIREAEPKEVHFRVTSPPIRFPCYYGMDFPEPNELIANRCNGDVDKIREELGVDSLAYLSLENLLKSVPKENGEWYCTACFSGEYPIPIDKDAKKEDHDY